MLLRTHVAFAALAIILLVKHMNNPLIFTFAVLIATLLPDVDNSFSKYGRNIFARMLQMIVKHRGAIHSITIGTILAILIAIYWPVASLGFFIGWSMHIFCDSFTKDGVRPFWPLKYHSKGFLNTGGKIEASLLVTVIIIDAVAFFFFVVF